MLITSIIYNLSIAFTAAKNNTIIYSITCLLIIFSSICLLSKTFFLSCLKNIIPVLEETGNYDLYNGIFNFFILTVGFSIFTLTFFYSIGFYKIKAINKVLGIVKDVNVLIIIIYLIFITMVIILGSIIFVLIKHLTSLDNYLMICTIMSILCVFHLCIFYKVSFGFLHSKLEYYKYNINSFITEFLVFYLISSIVFINYLGLGNVITIYIIVIIYGTYILDTLKSKQNIFNILISTLLYSIVICLMYYAPYTFIVTIIQFSIIIAPVVIWMYIAKMKRYKINNNIYIIEFNITYLFLGSFMCYFNLYIFIIYYALISVTSIYSLNKSKSIENISYSAVFFMLNLGWFSLIIDGYKILDSSLCGIYFLLLLSYGLTIYIIWYNAKVNNKVIESESNFIYMLFSGSLDIRVILYTCLLLGATGIIIRNIAIYSMDIYHIEHMPIFFLIVFSSWLPTYISAIYLSDKYMLGLLTNPTLEHFTIRNSRNMLMFFTLAFICKVLIFGYLNAPISNKGFDVQTLNMDTIPSGFKVASCYKAFSVLEASERDYNFLAKFLVKSYREPHATRYVHNIGGTIYYSTINEGICTTNYENIRICPTRIYMKAINRPDFFYYKISEKVVLPFDIFRTHCNNILIRQFEKVNIEVGKNIAEIDCSKENFFDTCKSYLDLAFRTNQSAKMNKLFKDIFDYYFADRGFNMDYKINYNKAVAPNFIIKHNDKAAVIAYSRPILEGEQISDLISKGVIYAKETLGHDVFLMIITGRYFLGGVICTDFHSNNNVYKPYCFNGYIGLKLDSSSLQIKPVVQESSLHAQCTIYDLWNEKYRILTHLHTHILLYRISNISDWNRTGLELINFESPYQGIIKESSTWKSWEQIVENCEKNPFYYTATSNPSVLSSAGDAYRKAVSSDNTGTITRKRSFSDPQIESSVRRRLNDVD